MNRIIVFIESNSSGTRRLFPIRARELGFRPVLLASDPLVIHFWSKIALTISEHPDRQHGIYSCSLIEPGRQLRDCRCLFKFRIVCRHGVAGRWFPWLTACKPAGGEDLHEQAAATFVASAVRCSRALFLACRFCRSVGKLRAKAWIACHLETNPRNR